MFNDDYTVPCFSGATRLQSELSAAFGKVANPSNWKLAIDATIALEDGALISDAVVHFTGSVPDITVHGQSMRVLAKGYYAVIGA